MTKPRSAVRRFTIPQVLAVTLVACGPKPQPQPLPDAGTTYADGGPVDCSTATPGNEFSCACCNTACPGDCGTVGAGSTQCGCLV